MRYFSLAEAEALLPELEKIYREVSAISSKAQKKAEEIKRLEEDPKNVADAAIARAQLRQLGTALNAWLQKVLDLGAIPKGLEPALVDFPHRLDGREVYLCWRQGEKRIAHYHGLDEGFAGRKPLPGTHRA